MNETSKYQIIIVLARLTVLVSICGCVWQLWDITDDYIAKEVVTEIKIETPRTMVLPDISFCARLPHFINYRRMLDKFPEVHQVIQSKYPWVYDTESYAKLMKFRDGYKFMFRVITERYKLNQITDILYTSDDIFQTINLVSNKHFGFMTKDELKRDCDIKSYARELDVCIRFSCAKNGRYLFTTEDISRSLFKEEVIEFQADHSVFKLIPHFNIMLHEPNSFPWGHQVASIVITSGNYSTLNYFSYKRFETNLLPPPFTTKCENYVEEGYLARLEKQQICENKLSIKKLNCPYYGNVHKLSKNAWHGYKFYFLQYNNETIQNIVQEIHDECKKVAIRRDCHDEYFVPKEKLPRPWKGQFTLFIMNPPTEPDIIHISKAKLPFSEYLIFIESIFGTWFGFCVAGSLPELYRWAFKKVPKAKKVLQQKQLRIKTYS